MKPSLVVASVALVVVACSTRSGARPAGLPACIERLDTYSRGDTFPSDLSLSATIEPECVPTCGHPRIDIGYPVAAMPAGRCSGPDAYTCDLPIRTECKCPGTFGALSGYRCACVDERWQCLLISQGGAGCEQDGPGRCLADAGAIPTCVERSERYTRTDTFPIDLTQSTFSEPACAPTCGVGTINASFRVGAMPAGACSDADAPCDMNVLTECACAGAFGAVNGYRCACSHARWQCTLISQGGAVCPHDCDAGTD